MSDAPASDRGARRAARAIDALRRGWPFRIEGADGALDLLAVESARDAALASIIPMISEVVTELGGDRVRAALPILREFRGKLEIED